jgi:RND family efflux transporter MFP subunit
VQEMRQRRRRWLWVGVAGVLILVAVGAYLLTPRPTRVSIATVERKTLANRIFASGTVKPIDRQIVMPQQLPGPIDQFRVQLGQKVHNGDVLLECEHSAQAAALSSARAAVAEAESTLAQTRKQAAAAPPGLQVLFSGIIATQESSLAQAKAQLSQAQAAYDATTIRAKLDGTVVILNPEGVSSDGTPSPVLEVVGDKRQVVAFVSEVDAVQVKPGMQADITSDAYPNRRWHAVVRRVAEFAVSNGSGSGQVEVDLGVPGEFPVPFGFQVDVNVTTQTKQRVPVIPYSAIVQDGNQYAVFVLGGQRAHKVPVTLGITTDTEVEVTSGLKAGETVIVNPPGNLKDGDKVTVS